MIVTDSSVIRERLARLETLNYWRDYRNGFRTELTPTASDLQTRLIGARQIRDKEIREGRAQDRSLLIK